MAPEAARQQIEQQIDDDRGQRQQQQRGEETRDREAVAGFEDAEGEPGFGAAGAGDKFGDDSADQRETAADPEAREKIRQRGRQPEIEERLAGRGAVKAEQREEV